MREPAVGQAELRGRRGRGPGQQPPVIALQVEYSLLARTVEGEVASLALDQGMALVPYSAPPPAR